MKKLLGLLVILFVIVLGWPYFFLPSSETLTASMTMYAPAARVYTLLAKQNEWSKWWPGQSASQAASLEYNGNNYRVDAEVVNTIEIVIEQKDSAIKSRILVIMKTIDTCELEWRVQVNRGSNPFKKIQYYFSDDTLKADMTSILHSFKKFVEKQETLYGMRIEKAQVTDTVLVATRRNFSHYPSTQEIYSLIEKLNNYIKTRNVSETNFPMLNIHQADSNLYNVMVAIPISRSLIGKDNIELKRMIPGKIIWGEVKGGPYSVEAAIKKLENFRIDYHLTSPAIPFASLVTDRMKEPDTTKWITRVYYPIF